MNKLTILLISLLILIAPQARAQDFTPVTIEWIGHGCFLVSSPGETKVLIDPYTPSAMVSYPTKKLSADVVVLSHLHADHNNVNMARGKPKIIRGLNDSGDWNIVEETVGDVTIKTVPVYHDRSMGQQRGKNTIIVLTIGQTKVVHLGDLGHTLSDKEWKQIGRTDILMIPVGGAFTINPEEIDLVIATLNPRVIIPMHYKTSKVLFPIKTLDWFIKDKDNVVTKAGSEISISELPETPQIQVLDWKK